MKKTIIFSVLIIISFSSVAQTVLLEVNRDKERRISERGPNLKKFTQGFFRFTFVTAADKEGARIKYGSSNGFALGIRKKYKMSPLYSMGFEADFHSANYQLKQNSNKVVPDTIINNISGSINYSSFGLGYFNRINFDPHRGNFLGSYLDIGIMGEFHFSINSVSKNKLPDGTESKNIISNLNFTNNTGAMAYARIGYSHISLYGSYRLTKLFKQSWNYPELPVAMIGLELGLF